MKKRKTIWLQGLMLNELQGRVDELEAELQELREDLHDEPITFPIVKSDPAPVPSCGVAQPGDIGGWYDCDRPQGHEGPHECDGTEWSDPAPTPEWRRLVEREVGYYALPVQARGAAYRKAPLPDVLHLLSVIAEIGGDCRTPLARIVSICEAQVGNEWQADPDRVALTEEFNESGWLGLLLYMIANYEGRVLWAEIGNNAAAWLRYLTDGGDA